MEISSFYYEVLGVKPGLKIPEIKKAYHRLVRKNHPDLFPDEQKELQELKMIQINEAYARISQTINLEENGDYGNRSEVFRPNEQQRTPTIVRGVYEVGFHRDIEYAYYKQGFTNYSKALSGIKRIDRKVETRNDMYYLRRFAASLAYLRRADMYFSKLLNEYPDSIWARDAYIKVRKTEYFNRLYRKILINIEKGTSANFYCICL